VAESSRDDRHRLAAVDEDARVRVTKQVPRRIRRQARLVNRLPPSAMQPRTRGWLSIGAAEDQSIAARRIRNQVRCERLNHEGWQRHDPTRRRGLERTEGGWFAHHLDQLAVDGDLAARQVDPIHGETERPTLPKPGADRQKHQRAHPWGDHVSSSPHAVEGQRHNVAMLDRRPRHFAVR
jgi:hypothetical protein